jgi:Uma2 family endonuclease
MLKLGPADHGRRLTLEEFLGGDYALGHKYELIHGKLYVSPFPNQPENSVEDWLLGKLRDYTREYPEIVNHVRNKARVFVPGGADVSAPEPDISVYHDFPLERRFRDLRWEEVSPVLVVEILSEEDPDKDLVRNAELYHQVPSIKEYWVIDTRQSAEQPSLRVHRRHGKGWRIKDLTGGESYTTSLLPGFTLQLISGS